MKKILKFFFNFFDYDLIKINVHSDKKAHKIYKVNVGDFILEMPGNNIQISSYKYNPKLNFQLGRLGKLIANKYPNINIVDVGANVGDTIAVLKTAVEVPVIGIEGDKTTYEFLKKNIQQFKDVIIRNVFLSDKSQSQKVSFDKQGWNTTIMPSDSGTDKVHFQTLDEVLNEINTSSEIKLLKVDVEGYDTIVLRGASHVIQKNYPVLYFEYNRENMDAIKENGLTTLLSFIDFGYSSALFFDAKGRFITKVPLNNVDLIKDLHYYIAGDKSMIPYYDLCLFHKEDEDLEKSFIEMEKKNDFV